MPESEEFKLLIEKTPYEVLLAGFPCQTFSRAGLEEGFGNKDKGSIFFHIVEIIKRTRPKGLFLENVDHLITHKKGNTFKQIINLLEDDLDYKTIGVRYKDDKLSKYYAPRSFIRNSKKFEIPQNRPRTYIIGFDRTRYKGSLNLIANQLPNGGL